MSSSKPQIMIVEPSAIVVEGLMSILNKCGQYRVVARSMDDNTLSKCIMEERPDMLIINPTLMSYPMRSNVKHFLIDNTKMVMVALVYQYVEASTLANYHAVLDIREPKDNIENVLQSAFSMMSIENATDDNYELSDREKEVLTLVAKGLMNKEIADKLNISIHTVISHRKNITKKTGIKSVAGLTMFAMMNNLF